MAAGGAVVLAMLALAAIVGANFIEPDNADEATITIGFIVIPPLLGGITLIVLGRALYGGWRSDHPLRLWGGRALFVLGLGLIAGLGVLLLLSLPRGFGEDNQGVLLSLTLGVIAGVLITFIGRALSRTAID